MPIREFVNTLILQSKKATHEQLAHLIDQAGTAPFIEDLLEVDPSLWGGFWQGDVISPGYRLPAIELALLRAMRLDLTWPEGTAVSQFLADLRQAITDPQAEVWTLIVADEPCAAFMTEDRRSETGGQRSAVGGRPLATVVWYCAATERLHAGYRTEMDVLNFRGAVEQRRLKGLGPTPRRRTASPPEAANQLSWFEQVETTKSQSLATRLDTEILRIRGGVE